MSITNEQDQEEIFSKVMIAFWEKCKKEEEIILTCKLSTFIGSITRNLALKHLSDSYVKRKQELNPETVAPDCFIESDFLDKDIKKELLKNSIKKLTIDKQKFLSLLFDGKSGKDIAKEMNLKNIDVVKTKKYKIIKELKQLCLL
jgi:DNA-binding NarL/FixJ family response regulator